MILSTLNWQLISILTGLMFFAYWINYAMGSPLASDRKNVDTGAILFGFPYWLATRKLIIKQLYWQLRESARAELRMVSDTIEKQHMKNDLRLDLYVAGRSFFTWEKSLLCPICLHWWLTFIFGFVCLVGDHFNAREDFWLAALTYLINHLIIRKIA